MEQNSIAAKMHHYFDSDPIFGEQWLEGDVFMLEATKNCC